MNSIDESVAALVGRYKTAQVAGVDVTDGPNYDPDVNYLAVAWAGDTAGIAGTRSQADGARNREFEDFDITCRLYFHKGDGATTAQVRSAVMNAFTQFDSVLRADRRLGGKCAMAAVTDFTITTDLTETGAGAELVFIVRIQGWS